MKQGLFVVSVFLLVIASLGLISAHTMISGQIFTDNTLATPIETTGGAILVECDLLQNSVDSLSDGTYASIFTADSCTVITVSSSAYPTAYITSTAIPMPGLCDTSWSCGDWSSCFLGTQTRTCTDANSCGTSELMPATTQACICTENWTCGDWDVCTLGIQNRTCIDSNVCGTTTTMPATNQTCIYCGDGICNGDEGCGSCYNDCGVCGGTGGGGGGGRHYFCGDGTCNNGETTATCVKDCPAAPVVQNLAAEVNETNTEEETNSTEEQTNPNFLTGSVISGFTDFAMSGKGIAIILAILILIIGGVIFFKFKDKFVKKK